MATNVHRVVADLRRFRERVVPEKFVVAHKKITLELLSALVRMSPVDEGTFRNNWHATAHTPDLSFDKSSKGGQRGSPPSSLQVSAALAALAGLKPFSRTHVSNGAPYGPRLNQGWSKQAPALFVETAVQQVTSQFR